MTPIEKMLREAYFDVGVKTGFENQAKTVEEYVNLEKAMLRQKILAARSEIDDLKDTVRELREIMRNMAQQAQEPEPEAVTNSFAEDDWISPVKPQVIE